MAALGTIAKTRKQLQYTRTDGWIQAMRCMYPVRYYWDIHKDESMPFPVTGKKPEVIILSEVRQGKREIIEHPFWWNLKMDTNELHYKRETSRTWERKLWVPKWKGGAGVISRFRSIHALKQVLLFSRSVVSDSLWPYGPQSTRLLCPWASPGENTGVRCHFLLQGIFPAQGLNPCLLQVSCAAGGFFTTEPAGKP